MGHRGALPAAAPGPEAEPIPGGTGSELCGHFARVSRFPENNPVMW
jgi:hypothetical protein